MEEEVLPIIPGRKLFRLCAKVYVTIIMDEWEDPYKKAIPHQLFAMSRQLVQQLHAFMPCGGAGAPACQYSR